MNLPELRRLAEAARPGPWTMLYDSYEDGTMLLAGGMGDDTRDYLVGDYMQSADAAYIAACDPQTVLRLLDVVEAARAVMTDDEDADPLPENEWDPRFLRLRDALAALDEL